MSFLIPYHEIKKDNQEGYVLNLSCIEDKVVFFERYCTTPECNCREVTLDFITLKNKEALCHFAIHLDTLKIRDKTQLSKKFNLDDFINEFIKNFESIKPIFEKHYQEAKLYGKTNNSFELPVDYIYELMVEGNTVPYSVCYQDIPTSQKLLNYVIEDYYCMNPSCKCYDVTLLFFKGKKKKFALTWSLKNNTYKIIDKTCSHDVIELATNYLLNDKKGLIDLYRERYYDMKEIGKKILQFKRPKPIKSKKVKPNDPCPCGSGLKYKKCCGG